MPSSSESRFARLWPSLRIMMTPLAISVTGAMRSAANTRTESAFIVPSAWLPVSTQSSGTVDIAASRRYMQFLNLLLSSATDAARTPQNMMQGIANSITLLQ